METFLDTSREMLKSISDTMNGLDFNKVTFLIESLVQHCSEKRKILIVGVGRSGLVGRAFALRLQGLGFNVYVTNETIVPSIEEGDLVFTISGSGKTKLPLTIAEMAKSLRARVFIITSYPDSPLGRYADLIIEIPGRRELALEEEYLARQLIGYDEPTDPRGAAFENSCMIFLDCVITELISRIKSNENKN